MFRPTCNGGEWRQRLPRCGGEIAKRRGRKAPALSSYRRSAQTLKARAISCA
jgi:hypothetical protein